MKNDFIDVIKKDKRFFREEEMKTSLQVIAGLVEKYSDNEQLGAVVREFIKELKTYRRKREENNH